MLVAVTCLRQHRLIKLEGNCPKAHKIPKAIDKELLSFLTGKTKSNRTRFRVATLDDLPTFIQDSQGTSFSFKTLPPVVASCPLAIKSICCPRPP